MGSNNNNNNNNNNNKNIVLHSHSLHVSVSAFCNSVASKAPLPSSSSTSSDGLTSWLWEYHAVDGRNPKQPLEIIDKKNVVNNGMNYQPQVVIAGFLNHQTVPPTRPCFLIWRWPTLQIWRYLTPRLLRLWFVFLGKGQFQDISTECFELLECILLGDSKNRAIFMYFHESRYPSSGTYQTRVHLGSFISLAHDVSGMPGRIGRWVPGISIGGLLAYTPKKPVTRTTFLGDRGSLTKLLNLKNFPLAS